MYNPMGISTDVNINRAFMNNLEELLARGREVTVRGKKTIELINHSFIITDPIKRALAIPYRYNNIAATIAETLWVFAGRNDLEFLHHFLPNCFDYSDDLKIWRGAYGPRIRATMATEPGMVMDFVPGLPTPGYLDQIYNVEQMLIRDKFTREALIVVPEPEDYDYTLFTKDRPCTIFVQFLIRDDKLHCFTRMRSNDIVWGAFNINVFEWTFLQEVLAGILEVEVGAYYHNATSFHIYDTMFERAKKIISCPFVFNLYSDKNKTKSFRFNSLAQFYFAVNLAMDILSKAINVGAFDPEVRTSFEEIMILQQKFFNWLPQSAKMFITFLNIPLSFLFYKKEMIKESMAFLLLNPGDIEFSYYIPHLEFLHRGAMTMPNDNGIIMATLIADNFYFDVNDKKYIFQQWESNP